MEKKSVMQEIIQLCLDIDTIAHDFYVELSNRSDGAMSVFWLQMSNEEKTHCAFWKKLLTSSDEFSLPCVFDDPESTLKELKKSKQKAIDLSNTKDNDQTKNLVAAYRMEFYLLHPAFETLFLTMGALSGGISPGQNYQDHIDKFISKMKEISNYSPELELLSEIIYKLWYDNRQLVRQTSIDPLTNIYNRRGFFNIVYQMCFLAMRNQYDVCVMMIDIDDFKKVNDTQGHLTGDMVISRVAETILNNIRRSDILGRYGGEEFIVFFPQTDKKNVLQLAGKIREIISITRFNQIKITVSIGLSCGKFKDNIIKELYDMINQADNGLYRSKETGKNKISYDPDQFKI